MCAHWHHICLYWQLEFSIMVGWQCLKNTGWQMMNYTFGHAHLAMTQIILSKHIHSWSVSGLVAPFGCNFWQPRVHNSFCSQHTICRVLAHFSLWQYFELTLALFLSGMPGTEIALIRWMHWKIKYSTVKKNLKKWKAHMLSFKQYINWKDNNLNYFHVNCSCINRFINEKPN